MKTLEETLLDEADTFSPDLVFDANGDLVSGEPEPEPEQPAPVPPTVRHTR